MGYTIILYTTAFPNLARFYSRDFICVLEIAAIGSNHHGKNQAHQDGCGGDTKTRMSNCAILLAIRLQLELGTWSDRTAKRASCWHACLRHRSEADIAILEFTIKVSMARTAHKTVVAFIRYVRTENNLTVILAKSG